MASGGAMPNIIALTREYAPGETACDGETPDCPDTSIRGNRAPSIRPKRTSGSRSSRPMRWQQSGSCSSPVIGWARSCVCDGWTLICLECGLLAIQEQALGRLDAATRTLLQRLARGQNPKAAGPQGTVSDGVVRLWRRNGRGLSSWRKGAADGFLVAGYPVKKHGPWVVAPVRVVTPSDDPV